MKERGTEQEAQRHRGGTGEKTGGRSVPVPGGNFMAQPLTRTVCPSWVFQSRTHVGQTVVPASARAVPSAPVRAGGLRGRRPSSRDFSPTATHAQLPAHAGKPSLPPLCGTPSPHQRRGGIAITNHRFFTVRTGAAHTCIATINRSSSRTPLCLCASCSVFYPLVVLCVSASLRPRNLAVAITPRRSARRPPHPALSCRWCGCRSRRCRRCGGRSPAPRRPRARSSRLLHPGRARGAAAAPR